jgi:hypothetical protein
MAKFTLVDDKTDITIAKMHVEGKKRLHLAGVGDDRKSLQVLSTKPNVVTATIIALFSGPKGIWTVDLKAKTKGSSEIQAKLAKKIVAKLTINVEEKILLPAATTEEGLLVRLFLSESRTPSESGYSATDAKTGMQWMRVVLENRLKNKPKQFNAPGAKKILDIVKAEGQFHGFEKYPTLSAAQESRINEIVSIANNDSDTRQEKFAAFLSNALDVANTKSAIKDPCQTGLYGWRTAGRGSPGPRFKIFKTPMSGNQFYTLKK